MQLAETLESLGPLEPSYVSVTYGAGGATREGTVEWVTRIKREHGIEAMAHLSCVGETTERLTEILEQLDRADQLQATHPQEADAIWQAIIRLYHERPWAADLVEKARSAKKNEK